MNKVVNAQGETGGNVNELECPKCGRFLIKVEGKCDCEYTCFNTECRGLALEYPTYYGHTQEDINNNVGKNKK